MEKSIVERFHETQWVHYKKAVTPYVLLLPSIVLIGFFKIYPIFYAIVLSFFKSGKDGIISFAFIQNYTNLFAEDIFVNSVWVTLRVCILTTAIQVLLAITSALFLNRKNKFVEISRTFLYIPVAINMVIACTIWSMFFSDSTGLVNAFLHSFGMNSQPWLTSSKYAFWVLMFICCWKGVSYWMMFLLAGLLNINESLYEAAKLDGANNFKQLFYITLPMMKNSLLFVIVSDTLINMFMFSPVYLLTNGGPSMSTDTLMYETYRSAFSYTNYPRAYALVTIMILMATVVASIQLFIMREKN
jgi:multiple sugar transport system permease protein